MKTRSTSASHSLKGWGTKSTKMVYWIYKVFLRKSNHAPVFELIYRFILYTVNCFMYTLEHCSL